MEKCIGCELCAGVCPARCIYVRGADNPIDDPVSPGERYGFVYEINYLRCIHCDLCVEACPTEAITETKLFEFSFTNRNDAIYTKAELLVDDDGLPQQLPWEDWRDGDETDVRRGCAPRRRPARRLRGPRGLVGRARLRRAAPRGRADRPRPTAAVELPPRPSTADGAEPTTTTSHGRAHDGRPTHGGRARTDGAVRLRRGRHRCSPAAARRGARRNPVHSALSWSPPCSASPCCSSPRTPTSSPRCRSSSTPARSSCCSCS